MRLRTTAATLAVTLIGGLVAGGLTTPASSVATSAGPAPASAEEVSPDADQHWFTSWSQSIQRRSGLTFTDRTVRQVSRLTQGGEKVRLRLENTFGAAPMVVGQTTVGRTGDGAGIVAGTLRTVLFDGAQSVTIPAGGTVWSDPLDFATDAQQDLTISFYLPNATVTTLHDRAGRTNWFAPNNGGNVATSESGAAFTEAHGWNYIVGAIDVYNEDLAGTVVAYGSSVVDGSGSESCGPGCTEPNPYMRWTDIVARRIASDLPADRQLALVNAGIGGTTASPACGSGGNDGVSRLSRDVLSLHGVTALIYYYGTNDIANLGNGCSAAALVSSMRATFSELRAAGIKVYVTPITPRPGYTGAQNTARSDVNAFIRGGGDCTGTCDGIVDFDAALRDPGNPNAIRPSYDHDGVHVNTLGQQALADAVPLAPLVAAGAAVFASPEPEAASLGQEYSYRLVATGYPAPTLSITSGALPDGLSLDAGTGVISGVPTERGRSTFTVEARNGAGTAVMDASIDVLDGPVFTNGEPPAATVGAPYDFSLRATGHPAPTFTVTAGALPAGLTLDAESGRIHGTPTGAGSSPVTVRASNGVGTEITTTFTLDVSAAPSATVLTLSDTSMRYGSGTSARILVFATGSSAGGTVELRAGSTLLGSASLVAEPDVPGMSAATIGIPRRALAPGAHRISARFAGDTRSLASSDTRRLSVAKAAARISAAVRDARNLTTGARGRVDVTVRAPGVSRHTGRVVIRDGGRRIGRARLSADGTAEVRLGTLRAGRRTWTVTYSGSELIEPGARTTLRVRVRRR